MATDQTQINPGLSTSRQLSKIQLENEHALGRMQAERGWLGRIWGTSSSVPNNVAALIAIVLTSFGMIYTSIALYLMPTGKEMGYIKDLWAIITPIITLSIGYLFGNRNSPKEEG